MRISRSVALALCLPAVGFSCSQRPVGADAGARDGAASTALPPPARPADLIAEAHFGHPRATVQMLGRMIGMRIPFELGLSLGLGLESSILSAADTARPMDVVVTGTAERPDIIFVLTPGTAQLRSQLAGRYRFVPASGLGERLESRTPRARNDDDVLHCALVGVPGDVPTRIVCARRAEALDHAGRYAAYASQRHEADEVDAAFDVGGEAVRRTLVPMARESIEELARAWGRSAAEERRRHGREPDYGDPEAIVAMVMEFANTLEGYGADVRGVRGRANVTPQLVSVEADVSLDPQGRSAFAREAALRVSQPRVHPLTARLPPNAAVLFDARGDAAARVVAANDIVDAVIRVLGTRLPTPELARADLRALFSNLGDDAAAGLTLEPDGHGGEATALFNTSDGGASARAALAQIARAPWLRAARFGGAPLTVSMRNDALVLRMGAAPARPGAPAPPARPGAQTAPRAGVPAAPSAPVAPDTVVIALAGDVLAVIVGRNPEASLTALMARTGGPIPAAIAHAPPAPVVLGIDPAALGSAGANAEPVHLTYSAARQPSAVVATVRAVVPARSIEAIRALIAREDDDPYANGGTGPAPRR